MAETFGPIPNRSLKRMILRRRRGGLPQLGLVARADCHTVLLGVNNVTAIGRPEVVYINESAGPPRKQIVAVQHCMVIQSRPKLGLARKVKAAVGVRGSVG
ncbi:predicted protein [Chaetomium globosum CBS 148.51]|uniref:Uncharacterized protein n=1 Tax=Chaetomium globosum (strain ATCC 6205 / CBS 148.51 / DSM 1962 / NBRC 6347 / NRRL 1970) TaxID=306901 RepID=Q2GPU0_CHAGB|nr:uncharacterized protein CHGG_10014 [Chaetomium globosum CBS 148.51]EAQ83610.1 predicted protein [Chaetomium globosum CBS 148.51]